MLVLAAAALATVLAAYFHVRAVNALIREALLSRKGAQRPSYSVGVPRDAVPAGDIILERNVFDSRTGPLPKPSEPPPVPAPPVDPLRAPRCAGVRVVATTQSQNPLESTAMVETGDEPRASVRRVGDMVGHRRVAFIGRNPVEWGPAVWLSGDDGLCQTVLFDQPPPPGLSPAASAPVTSAKEAQRSGGASKLPHALAAKIERLSSTSFGIDRTAFEAMVESATTLLRSVRLRPAQVEGKVVGFELRKVPAGSLLDVIGLKSGDRLLSVNGYELTGPAAALQAYAKLRTASTIRVQATRGGTPLELEYRIR
ncbi:MAG TPA: type II secretion system protein GspC [Polyangiaceae bacterium]